jgi:HlyD family secretion protein
VEGGLFRKAAIDKVSSPEQLDLTMQVTSPIGWLALTTIGVLLAAVVLWSVLGSIPDLVDAQGATFRGERLAEVQANMAGRIDKLAVAPGRDVKAGQVIAVIRLDVASMEERSSNEANIARNRGTIASMRAQIQDLRVQMARQQELVREGLKPEAVLFEYRSKIASAEAQLNGLLKETSVLESRLQSTAEITSPETGRVTEVVKAVGDLVRAGEPLLRLEPSTTSEQAMARQQFCGGELHTILYIPAQLAGKVRPGQEARVSPTDVKKEEHGYLLGRVEWVAPAPASTEDMRGKLKNDQLVSAFAGGGPVVEARVCLQPDPTNTLNGFKWSSSTGPDKPIQSGSAVTASLVVDLRKPYTYVIPTVRKMVGL